MCKKRIFIGSSSEQIKNAEKIAIVLENLGHSVKPWWGSEVFPPGAYTFDSILNVARSVDAGLFLLAEDDFTKTRGEIFPATRDNVLIEAGIFFGALGRNSVGLFTVGIPKTPSDWKGITVKCFSQDKINNFKGDVEVWLGNVEYKHNKKPNNVHMERRADINVQYPLKERLGGHDIEMHKHITQIKIINLASNLFINPTEAEPDHIKHDSVSLSDVMTSIVKNSTARISLILAKPTDNVLKDAKTKIANSLTAEKVIYSAHSKLYKLLTQNDDFIKSKTENRFLFKVTEVCIPFAIFAVEYDQEHSFLNHVKIDLYSAALTSENERRSMVIWKNQDSENYKFFMSNFDSIWRNDTLCSDVDMEEMRIWSDIWDKLKINDTR